MIHINNVEHGKRIMAETDAHFSEVTMKVISRTENKELYGGVVYENWTGAGGSCVCHVAGFRPMWLNRDMMFVIFDYPFIQLDCKVVFVQVAANNEKSIHFCHSVGFTDYVRLEDVFPDGDMILMRLKRDDCRFLGVKPRTIQSRRTDTWESQKPQPRQTTAA